MPTTREVDAKRTRRRTKAPRYYDDPDRTGPVCADKRCKLKLDAVLAAQGENTHATCTAEARRLLKVSRAACYRPPTLEQLAASATREAAP
jgi:hypothetical protein